MKIMKVLRSIIFVLLLLSLIACDVKRNDNEIIQEPDENENIFVSVEKIESYENIEISDWLDESSVIVSKENEVLEKMSLEELSDLYPRSLYSYNINTKEYNLIKEQENIFLGGALLSEDNKHLLYFGNSLGDSIYYVMNMDTLESFNIVGAYSANWADDGVVVGGSYMGGVYLASTSGEITSLSELENESIFIVRKIKNRIYYNTNFDLSLMMFDVLSKENKSLGLDNVYGIFPSPEGDLLLLLQNKGSKVRLVLCDSDGENIQILAEGEEIGGVEWSPDQKMIAYNLNDTQEKGIYIYDRLTDKDTKIVSNVDSPIINWSPSGEKLSYIEYNGFDRKSSIVYLKYNLDQVK